MAPEVRRKKAPTRPSCTVVEHTGIEAAPHLTCVGSTRAHIAELLQRYRDAGVKRIVALRGDLPATAMSASAPGEFHYASELVSFIRKEHGDAFRIEVAAYPEMHPQAASPSEDFENFRRKVEAGADAALTQLFYNADAYFDFHGALREGGDQNSCRSGHYADHRYANTMRFCSGCGADMPRWVRLRLEELQDDKPALHDFGLSVVTRLCETLLAAARRGCTSTRSTRPGPRCACGRIFALAFPLKSATLSTELGSTAREF